MESKHPSYIEQEVSLVIQQLDENRMLSGEDRLELEDHFLSEVDRLLGSGLNDEEAMLVAKKRFGIVEEIREEYEKIKPKFDLLRYGIIGVVAYCLIKSYVLLVNLCSQLLWLAYYQFDAAFVRKYAMLDIYLRLILILLVAFIGSKFINKVNFKNLSSMWFFPIVYLALEVGNRLYGLVIPMGGFDSDTKLIFSLMTNSYFVNIFWLVFIMIFASYKMYKMKVWDMEYV